MRGWEGTTGQPDSEYEHTLTLYLTHYTGIIEGQQRYMPGDPVGHGARQIAAVKLLNLEQGNLLGVFELALQRQLTEALLRCAAFLGQGLLVGGHYDLLSDLAAKLVRFAAERQADHIRLAGLLISCQAGQRLSQYRTAADTAGEAVELAERLTRQQDKLLALRIRGIAQSALGLAAEAVANLQQAYDEAKQHKDVWQAALALHDLAGEDMNFGKAEQAARRFQQAAADLKRCGDIINLARCTNNMALARIQLGDFVQAAELLHEAHDLYGALDNARGQAVILINLGGICLDHKDYTQARKHFIQAVHFFRDSNHKELYAATIFNLGILSSLVEDHSKAKRLLRKARELFRRCGKKLGEASVLRQLALVNLQTKAPRRARRYLLEAFELALACSAERELLICCGIGGALLARLGQPGPAQRFLHQFTLRAGEFNVEDYLREALITPGLRPEHMEAGNTVPLRELAVACQAALKT